MSFITKMRRILGLDDSIEGEPQYLDDVTSNADVDPGLLLSQSRPDSSPAPAEPQSIAPVAPVQGEVESIAADMLAEVVAIFNAFQPEFIARSLDPARQEALLTEKMTPALKNRLEAIASARREQVDTEARAERVNLDADMKRMRTRNAELERRRTQYMDEQLSAKRQKRALKERITDLEAQITRLNAEKEQLELEKQSMANKIRVASLGAAVDNADAPAIAAARKKLAEAEAAVADATAKAESRAVEAEKRLADAAAATEDLKTRCDALMAERDDAVAQSNAATSRAIAAEQDNEALHNAVESLKERCKVADEMISTLRKRVSAAEKKADEISADDRRQEQLAKAANIEIDRLRAQVESLRKELEQSAETADAIARKDARINELKARLRDASKVEQTIERLQKENRSLKETIEANLYEHAAQISSLRRELETYNKPRRGRPRKERQASGGTTDGEKPTGRKSPSISAIDELIEGCEWMKAPSPDELKAAPAVHEPSEDFGYRPPAKKPQQPDDTNQLTLF